MPKTSKSIPRKPAARKSTTPRKSKLQPATPPPDNPLLRHEAYSPDRLGPVAGVMAAAAAEASGADGESEVKKAARLRLAALSQAPGQAPNTPPMAMSAEDAPEPGGPFGVAPVSGISNWVQLGPITVPKGQTYGGGRVLITGRVTAIVVDPTNPQTIYLGSAQGGVWKTINGGKHWDALTDNEVSLAIGALAIDPSNPAVLYVGTGEGNFSGDSYYGNGILKTNNGGASWTSLAAATFVGTRFSRIAVTPGTTTRLFAANGNGLYRSTDGGVTWTLMAGGLPFAAATDVVIDPATPATVYAAFWGQGIYKSTNAAAAAPAWTKLTSGLPASSFTRIALSLSSSSPLTLYALIADNNYSITGFYRTTNGGAAWSAIALPGGNIGGQGFYNLNVTVDPTTPDIVYLSATSLWKATRNTGTGAWTITDIGGGFHPDNHAFTFDPINHLVIYAGSDGGFYKSIDGGVTWTDSLNKGPCITQFEFLDQHPSSDAVVFGGTQDNGTEQFRNHPVFNHADDGDGGCCIIDASQPNNVLSTYYNPTPKRSVQAGKFGTWTSVNAGIAGAGNLFYPPLTADQTNPNNVAIGTDQINLDAAQGAGGWPTKVALPGISGVVSAIHYVTSTLIYVASGQYPDSTSSGGSVYKLTKSGTTWTAALISAAPLPSRFVWDIRAVPGSPNTVVLVMSSFGVPHVWRGVVPATGTAAWTSISTGLPDIPVNALVIDPAAPSTMFIATDIAVYRTTNSGASWAQFSEGLPNCAVFDLQLHATSRLLRAGTHGRGLWERRLDLAALPNVSLFVRDHLMDSARASPSVSPTPAAFEDPLHYVSLGDNLYWWMCADIKVDALEGATPSYQFPIADVDTVAFESALQHRNAQRGNVNRVYVQVHNRGIQAATGVTVKVHFADASAGLPPLPPDFWAQFPNDSANTTQWTPIGPFKVLPSVSTSEPAILEWDWNTPLSAADHTCLMVVIDCASDPIPASSKVFDVWNLVPTERRAGLKNLHIVNIPPGTVYGTPFHFAHGAAALQTIKFLTVPRSTVRLGMMLPKGLQAAAAPTRPVKQPVVLKGVTVTAPTAAQLKSLRQHSSRDLSAWDLTKLYVIDPASGAGSLSNFPVPREGVNALLVVTAPAAAGAAPVTFTVMQQDGERLVGGSTFIVRTPTRG